MLVAVCVLLADPSIALAQEPQPLPPEAQGPDAGSEQPLPAEPAAPAAAAVEESAEPSFSNLESAAFSASGEDELPMSDVELQALGIDRANAGVDTSLQLSGFADFSVATQMARKSSFWRSSQSVPSHSSFYIGNFNLYIKKNLTQSLRTMGEVRFSYLPNGVANPVDGTRSTTETMDYNDYGRPTRWGGIELERVYLEWTAHPLLLVRAGQFLTPYGIWNVDHGSPTYIPVQRPFVVGQGWFPERQTGFEFFGRWDALSDQSIGYHLTLSNGTGPVSEYLDLDEHKAIGGRAYWEYRGLGELRIGASTYYGRHTDAIYRFYVTAAGNESRERINVQYDGLAFAADLSWKYQGWHVQSEWVSYQQAYTAEGRVTMNQFGTPQTPADSRNWGMYGLVGYRFRWLGVMPFAVVEHINSKTVLNGIRNITLQGGLNVRPIDALALKLVYYHVRFFEGEIAGNDPLRLLQAQAAWAF